MHSSMSSDASAPTAPAPNAETPPASAAEGPLGDVASQLLEVSTAPGATTSVDDVEVEPAPPSDSQIGGGTGSGLAASLLSLVEVSAADAQADESSEGARRGTSQSVVCVRSLFPSVST